MTYTVMSTDLPVNDPTNPAHRLADDLRNGRIPGYAADDVRAVLTMLAASPQGEGSSADADTHRAIADGCSSLDETALQRLGEEVSYSTNVRALGLYDYSSYPAIDGGLKPHVVRDELARGKVVFESDDPAEARAEYIRLCHVFIGRRAVELATTASSVGMSEANAPYRVTEGVKP